MLVIDSFTFYRFGKFFSKISIKFLSCSNFKIQGTCIHSLSERLIAFPVTCMVHLFYCGAAYVIRKTLLTRQYIYSRLPVIRTTIVDINYETIVYIWSPPPHLAWIEFRDFANCLAFWRKLIHAKFLRSAYSRDA